MNEPGPTGPRGEPGSIGDEWFLNKLEEIVRQDSQQNELLASLNEWVNILDSFMVVLLFWNILLTAWLYFNWKEGNDNGKKNRTP